MAREEYLQELRDLRDGVVQLSSMVSKAIARSTEALKSQNITLAKQVIADDKAINMTRWTLEESAQTLIATQAPMARDLRLIIAGLHILTDLERIGDHAAGNAKIAILNAEEPPIKPLVDIPKMAVIAQSMLEDSMSAFIEQSESLALSTAERDDEVDDLHDDVIEELVRLIGSNEELLLRGIRLMWAAHNIERMADRSTNICEMVEYCVSGKIGKLPVSTY